jgi:hypothetical protein
MRQKDAVTLWAPLEPNINPLRHHLWWQCGRRGHAGRLAAGVSQVAGPGVRGQVMVRRSQMDYQKAMHGAFTASTLPVADTVWQRMAATLAKGRMARLQLAVELECGEAVAGRLDGEFVVLPPN